MSDLKPEPKPATSDNLKASAELRCMDLLGIGDRLKLYFDNFEAVWHVKRIHEGVVTLARNGSDLAIDWSQLFLGGLMEHLRKGGAVKMPNDKLTDHHPR